MKTIKTTAGNRHIEEKSADFTSLQLRTILQEHRSTLIDNIFNGGLSRYVDYKFSRDASQLQLTQIKTKLDALKASGINFHYYQSIFDSVNKYDYVHLGNALFFMEIDELIKKCFSQVELFGNERRGVFQI
jgi:hypothetical protein